jgi:hypothetical protein
MLPPGLPGSVSGLAAMLAHIYRGAFTACHFFKCALVGNYIHPCVMAAEHLMCTRPPDVQTISSAHDLWICMIAAQHPQHNTLCASAPLLLHMHTMSI